MSDDAYQLDEETVIGDNPAGDQFQEALEHRQTSDLETYLPASFGPRAGAHLVDMLLLMGILTFVSNLIGMASSSGGQFVSYLVSGGLLTFFLLRGGQTPGKKIFKLKAVTHPEGAPISMKHALMREFFGRLILTLTLGLGYLTTLFRADKKALHDLIGQTIVLDLESHVEVPFGKRILRFMSPIVGLFLFGLLHASLMLFSSEPLRDIATRLEASGLQVDGLEGSLATGFRAQALRRDDHEVKLNITEIVVDYDLLATIKHGGYVINEISADQFHLEIKELPVPLPGGRKKRQADDSSEGSAVNAVASSKKGLGPMILKDLHVNSLVVKSGEKRFALGKSQLSNFEIDQNNGVRWERLEVNSDPVQLSIGELMYQKGEDASIAFSVASMDLIVRPSLFPDVLSGPVDISGKLRIEFDGQTKKITNFDAAIKGLNDRLKIERADGKINLTLKDWEPAEQIKGFGPVRVDHVNWSVPEDAVDPGQLAMLFVLNPPKARLRLGERPFENRSPGAGFTSEDGRLTLSPNLAAFKGQSGSEPRWTLSHKDDREYDELQTDVDFVAVEIFNQQYRLGDDQFRDSVTNLRKSVAIAPPPQGGWDRERPLEDDLTLPREALLLATAPHPPRSIVVRKTMIELMKCNQDAIDEGEALIAGAAARTKDAPLKPKIQALLARCEKQPRAAFALMTEAMKARPDDPLIGAFMAQVLANLAKDKESESLALKTLQDPLSGRLAQAWSLKVLMDHAKRNKDKKKLARWQKVLQERQNVWRAPASSQASSQNETPAKGRTDQVGSNEGR